MAFAMEWVVPEMDQYLDIDFGVVSGDQKAGMVAWEVVELDFELDGQKGVALVFVGILGVVALELVVAEWVVAL